jgi:membrane fusion protein, macrolide-specific efflux system
MGPQAMNIRRVILGGLSAIAVTATAGWWYMDVQAQVRPEMDTVEVRRGDLERTVTAIGKLEPLQYVDVGTQVSGQLSRIHVQPGDQVKAGDLLAEIDPTVYRARVAADKATLLSLEAQLVERKAMLKLAIQQHERQQGLFKSNATSRDALDSAAAEAEAAKARVAATEAEIGKARSTLEADEANLGYTRITAPMDGTVMSLTARQGQTLNANQSAPIVLQIADLETMTVRTQVSEADIGKLAVGMEAYFSTLGDPDRRWTGTLRQILPTPEVLNDVVLYNALFEADNADRRLMPQMTAQVFFVLGRAEDAVIAPVSALGPMAGRDRYEVQVMAGERVETRTVTVGIQDRVNAVILDGLEPGDRLVPAASGGTAPAARRDGRAGAPRGPMS